MSSAIKILPHYTYEDYCHWEGRWELIDGIPYAMSPAPVPEHQRVNMSLGRVWGNAIIKARCKNSKVYDFIDIKFSEDTILQPDLLTVCKPDTKNFLDFPATSVVEILSPATSFKDRQVKFSLYEKMGIKYFLIVGIDKKTVEINMLENNQYQLTSYSENLYQFLPEDECKN